jgi:hypothetical protein
LTAIREDALASEALSTGKIHTVKRLDLRQAPLPALVLIINVAKVGDEERFFRIGFIVGGEAMRIDYTVPQVHGRMPATQRRKVR